MPDLADLDVLVLCGGKGERLRSAVPDRPKVLADIHGHPFLEHLLSLLERSGFRRAILCTGHGHEPVDDWVRNAYRGSLDVVLSREESPLGTGGAVKNAEARIDGDRFLVMNGDTFPELDYEAFLRFQVRKKARLLVALSRTNDRDEYGSVRLDAESAVTSFREKISGGEGNVHVNAGTYLIHGDVLDLIAPGREVSMEREVIPSLLGEGVFGYVTEGTFLDIGTPERLAKASGLLPRIEEGDP